MWALHATLGFCWYVSLVLANLSLATAASPTPRASQRFFRAAAAARNPSVNVSNSPPTLFKDVGRHSGAGSLLRRPYCTLGGPGAIRFASERIDFWIDPETNTRYIRSGKPSKTALAAKCQGPFKTGDCLTGHPMNGAPPDCSSLRCPCSIDTASPVPGARNGKLQAAQAALVKEIGNLCAQKRGSFSVLLLGLRRAVLPAYLAKRCPRRLHIDTVESNQYVIDAARNFLGLEYDEQYTVQQADAWQYLMRINGTKKRYDAILTDCFGGDGHIMETCRAPSFFARLRTILRPEGVSIQNVGSEASKSMLMGYVSVFGKANVALMGPDENPVQLTGLATSSTEQMIRAVATPLRVVSHAKSSVQPNSSAAAQLNSSVAAKFNTSKAAQSNTSVAAQSTSSEAAESNASVPSEKGALS